MKTLARLSAYGVALTLLFMGGYAVGTAAGPLPTGTGDADGHEDAHGGTAEATVSGPPDGLASSRGGYTLTSPDPTFAPGTTENFTFRITGPDGAPVTAFVEHGKRMHLVVVRRDTTGFQHVHPEMDTDGTWRVPLTLPAGGSYRAFADFTPSRGEGTTLGMDLVAPGSFAPVAHSPSRTAQVDGYAVDLTGDLVPGQACPLTLTVSKAGQPVTDLQPYLAAYGHLVALRKSDLAYLHVHPGDSRTPPGPELSFVVEVPSAETYRLFLDFQHAGVVRTAEFTVPAGDGHGR